MSSVPLLDVNGLVKDFVVRRKTLRAVDDVSFHISSGETLALVGESGSGKSTAALCATLLEKPSRGSVRFDGVDMVTAEPSVRRRLRRDIQFVFQDPSSSLDPRMSVEEIVREPLDIHRVGNADDRRQRVIELLDRVGIDPAAAGRRPASFSGGQRQRIGIARALALQPKLIVCDEPVSALDVSVQAQVINLLVELRAQESLSYLFIAHDLAVVRHIADRIAVMYLGTIVEIGSKAEVFGRPAHPYTAALLSAVPSPEPDRTRERIVLRGEPPSPFDRPDGCVFQQRCWRADDLCRRQRPVLVEIRPGQHTACHHPIDDPGVNT
jgi:oligopeptide/dipeptide ABC transporter ATP-binding protein